MLVIQRVCKNSNGWSQPSGDPGTSGEPGVRGFGDEEWNFCRKDVFRLYHYMYLYWNPSSRVKKLIYDFGGQFDVAFWAYDPEQRKRLVAVCRDAELLTDTDRLEFENFLIDTDRHLRRATELSDALRKAASIGHAAQALSAEQILKTNRSYSPR
jgi:hypothetical protein